MSKELIAVPQDKKVATWLEMYKKGKLEKEVAQVKPNSYTLAENLSITTSLVSSVALGLYFFGGDIFPRDLVTPVSGISILHFLLTAFGPTVIVDQVVRSQVKKMSYSRELFLSHFKPKEQAYLISLIEKNEREVKLRGEYKADSYLFIVTYFGECTKELALKIKNNLDSSPTYLCDLIEEYQGKNSLSAKF